MQSRCTQTEHPPLPSPLYLQVLLQAPEQLLIDLPRLGVAQPLPLRLPQTILQDPAVLIGPLQLTPHLLQLTSVLLVERVSHLVHLGPHLLDFTLAREGGRDYYASQL